MTEVIENYVDDEEEDEYEPFLFPLSEFPALAIMDLYLGFDFRDPQFCGLLEAGKDDDIPTALFDLCNEHAFVVKKNKELREFDNAHYTWLLERGFLQHEQDIRFLIYILCSTESQGDQFPNKPLGYNESRGGKLVPGILHAYFNGAGMLLVPYLDDLLPREKPVGYSDQTWEENMRKTWTGALMFSKNPHMPPHMREWMQRCFLINLKAYIISISPEHASLAEKINVY